MSVKSYIFVFIFSGANYCADRGAFDVFKTTDFFFGLILSLTSTLTVRFFFEGEVVNLTAPSSASSVNTELSPNMH